MKMTNKVYDVLKIIALICLPLATLVSALSDIWGFPYGMQIAATLTAIDTFLGAILKASSDKYAKKNDEEAA